MNQPVKCPAPTISSYIISIIHINSIAGSKSLSHSHNNSKIIMADPNTRLPLTRQSVIEAHELIKPHIHLTPVLTNRTIDQIASTPQTAEALKGTEWEGKDPAKPKVRLWFKCENLQRVGAFKVRGAFHALKRLEEEEGRKAGRDGKEVGFQEGGWRQRGVVTHSSGSCLPFFFLFPLCPER